MKGEDFFNNLRDTDESEFEFDIPQVGKITSTANDVVQSLLQEKGANNINITITINKGLFNKIENLQKDIQSKNSGNKISKSKIVAKICEQFLKDYDVNNINSSNK